MKTRTLFLLFLLFSISVVGQEVSINQDTIPQMRKNVIKFLPENLIFNSLSFEFERKFSPKSSFLLGVGLASPKSFANKYNLNSSPDNVISNDEFSIMSVRAAYRHYAGHHVRPVGFYFSPYLKYQKIAAKANNHRTITEGFPAVTTQYDEKYDVKGNTLNFGIQWGVQFLIAKRLCIDFYFLGIEGGLADVTAIVKSPNTIMIDKVESGVRENVDKLPSFLSSKIKVTRNGSDQVDVSGKSMPYPWLRSGISIGLAF
ncbi:MAG: hypothetical protein M0Q53_03270 [Prolixibacteraceae bacterium]|jgi:hypothetical protein|nr:hypothetical protein [Prolixibacteraceae bacterium]